MADSLYGNYFYIDVKARCTVNGKEYPLTGFSLNYGINSVPAAVISLPIGRAAGGAQFDTVSKAADLINSIQPFQVVEVFAKLTAKPSGRGAPAGKKLGFPDGTEFKIFEGYVSSPGYVRSFTQATVSFQCIGKTAGLVGGSSMVQGATFSDIPNGSAEAISFFGGQTAATLFTAVSQEITDVSDLYLDAIEPVIQHMLSAIEEFGSSAASELATEAFERLNIFKALPSGILDLGALAQVPITKPVLTTITEAFWDTWASDDFTGDILSAIFALAPVFGFKMISAIEEDALLPVTFGLGGEPFAVIDPDEYWGMNFNTQINERFLSYITKVGIYTDNFQSSPWQASGAASVKVGSFTIPNQDDGQLILRRAPAWLLPYPASAKDALNPGNAVPDATDPAATASPPDQGAAETKYLDAGLGDDYAKAILYDQIFAHRKLSFNGRLRFDIAPGSLIQINTPGERFTGVDATLFGHVNTVTIEVGVSEGETSFARTSFNVTHVRGEAEHAAFTTDKHPLFNSKWVGGRLSDKA